MTSFVPVEQRDANQSLAHLFGAPNIRARIGVISRSLRKSRNTAVSTRCVNSGSHSEKVLGLHLQADWLCAFLCAVCMFS